MNGKPGGAVVLQPGEGKILQLGLTRPTVTMGTAIGAGLPVPLVPAQARADGLASCPYRCICGWRLLRAGSSGARVFTMSW